MKQRDRMHEFIGQLLATGAVGEQPVLPVLDDAIPAGETVATSSMISPSVGAATGRT